MNADLRDGHRRVVGTKQLIKCLEQDQVSCVFVAQDADAHVTRRVLELAGQKGVVVTNVPTMQELGKQCGIAVGAAAAGILR